jgi:glycosyltransferase involved in cell wall biosynthesis
MSKTIAMGYNTCHYVWLFRRNLLQALMQDGHDVVIMAPEDTYTEHLLDMGAKHFDVPMKMNKNPVSDYFLYRRFLKAFRAVQPDIYLGYTIKPNVYGSMAAHKMGVPTVNNIAGLGTVFISDGIVARIAKTLYRVALGRAGMVFFQNPDDRQLFTTSGIVKHDRHDLLPGSGVDLLRFSFSPLPVLPERDTLRFLLIGRMLWDKGVGEYVEAARQIRKTRPDIQFCLLGGIDNDNPSAISKEQIDRWVAKGHVDYLGYSDDVPGEILKSDGIVLPSAYPEGTPRTLLEAASMGRPLITTDAPGCRSTVDDGITGYLCALRDTADLQNKIEKIIALSPQERCDMGRAGRAKMEREFDEAIVIGRYLNLIRKL